MRSVVEGLKGIERVNRKSLRVNWSTWSHKTAAARTTRTAWTSSRARSSHRIDGWCSGWLVDCGGCYDSSHTERRQCRGERGGGGGAAEGCGQGRCGGGCGGGSDSVADGSVQQWSTEASGETVVRVMVMRRRMMMRMMMMMMMMVKTTEYGTRE